MTILKDLLPAEERQVVELVEDIVAKHGRAPEDDQDADLAGVREAVVEAGLWTVGVPAELGGGGAPLPLRQAVLAALGHDWAATAWASAQAQTAAEIIGADKDSASLVAQIHDGSAVICVVDATQAGPEGVRIVDGHASGRLARLDAAGEATHLLLLDGQRAAWLVGQESFVTSATMRRTGLAGAKTVAANLDGPARRIINDRLIHARSLLALAGAAIAAGLAAAASDRARAYAAKRIQFGRPLTAFPTVRQALFNQYAEALAALSLALNADPHLSAAAAGALYLNCERAISVAGAALQSHGGYGYLAEYDVERLVRDAVSLRAATDAAGFATRAAAALLDSAS